jgi:hypothetical protein
MVLVARASLREAFSGFSGRARLFSAWPYNLMAAAQVARAHGNPAGVEAQACLPWVAAA